MDAYDTRFCLPQATSATLMTMFVNAAITGALCMHAVLGCICQADAFPTWQQPHAPSFCNENYPMSHDDASLQELPCPTEHCMSGTETKDDRDVAAMPLGTPINLPTTHNAFPFAEKSLSAKKPTGVSIVFHHVDRMLGIVTSNT
jgi:hypothetical protein